MNRNYLFTNVNDALPSLMQELLRHGEDVGSRAGRTKELTHVGITLRKPWQREIVIPERKASIAAQIAETMWVLSGRNDIEWLSHYLPRAADFSDDGETWRAGYGPRLRAFQPDSDYTPIDQVDYVINTLRAAPSSRQAVISLWDPTVDTTPGKDIACNNWLNFSSRLGKLDLHVVIRSNDAMWGWSGINEFEWSALQEILAGMLGLQIGSLHFSVTSFHIYDRHWEKARRISEVQGNFLYNDSPRFDAQHAVDMAGFDGLADHWFDIEKDIRLQDPGANGRVEAFPEPMLRSWLRVLQWWWSGGDPSYLDPIRHTRIYQACVVGVQPSQPEPVQRPPATSFLDRVDTLHQEKHAAYGDSWKRRGEVFGIMPNIARKIDRLGRETSDETAADTAIDLMVYLGKYRWWLVDYTAAPLPTTIPYLPTHTVYSNLTEPVDALLRHIDSHPDAQEAEDSITELEKRLVANFDELEQQVLAKDPNRHLLVNQMLEDAYLLARQLAA